jgi:hypothetical protein
VLQGKKKRGCCFFLLARPAKPHKPDSASAISRSKLPHSILWSAIVIAKSYLIQFFRVMMDLVSVSLSEGNKKHREMDKNTPPKLLISLLFTSSRPIMIKKEKLGSSSICNLRTKSIYLIDIVRLAITLLY